jgi:DNA repair protein RecO
MLITENAIVLSRRKEADTNALIHCMNEEGRIIPIRVHGIMITKKRDILTTEPGSLVSVTYYHSETDKVNSQKEAVVKERFASVKESYEGLTLLAYILELTESLAQGEPDPKIYELLILGLTKLSSIIKDHPEFIKNTDSMFLFFVFYKVRLLKNAGLLEESEIIENLDNRSDLINHKEEFTSESEFIRELAAVYKYDIFFKYFKLMELSQDSLKDLNSQCDRIIQEYILKEPRSASEIRRILGLDEG